MSNSRFRPVQKHARLIVSFRQNIFRFLTIIAGFLSIAGFPYMCQSQDLPYAHYIINTLASKEYAGRGYVNDGCGKAADFIRNQFDSLGLLPFSKKFSQPFSFSVNTFPGKINVTIGGKRLVPGDDFIVHPYSAKANGHYRLENLRHYNSPAIFNDHKNVCYKLAPDSIPESEKKMLMDDLLSGKIKSGALIFLQPVKLTWSVGKGHYKIPVISVLQYYVPEHAAEVDLLIEQKQLRSFDAENLVGYVKGALYPDSFMVFSAHYDHLGMMGSEVFFPGANDNASGVSMLLNLARHFSGKENVLPISIAFLAFAGEEAGLVGSKYYTEHPLFSLSKIRFLVNLDLMGTGEEGMMVVNATEYPKQFQRLDSLNTVHGFLPVIKQRGKAKNSDHYWFTENGVPSFFFYTMGGIQAYHDVNDKAETLPLTEYEAVFRLLVAFTKWP